MSVLDDLIVLHDPDYPQYATAHLCQGGQLTALAPPAAATSKKRPLPATARNRGPPPVAVKHEVVEAVPYEGPEKDGEAAPQNADPQPEPEPMQEAGAEAMPDEPTTPPAAEPGTAHNIDHQEATQYEPIPPPAVVAEPPEPQSRNKPTSGQGASSSSRQYPKPQFGLAIRGPNKNEIRYK